MLLDSVRLQGTATPNSLPNMYRINANSNVSWGNSLRNTIHASIRVHDTGMLQGHVTILLANFVGACLANGE